MSGRFGNDMSYVKMNYHVLCTEKGFGVRFLRDGLSDLMNTNIVFGMRFRFKI